MKYNDKDQRGVLDRSFKPIKLNFHKQSSYETVLEKLKRVAWGTEDKGGAIGGTYFLADASGVSIQQKTSKSKERQESVKFSHGH